MNIEWVKPNASQLAQGILALRPITCFCLLDNGTMQEVDWFGGYTDKVTKQFISRRPAVIAYTRDMLIRRWQEGKELPPWVRFERRKILPKEGY